MVDMEKTEGGKVAIEKEVMVMESVGEHPYVCTLYEAFEQPDLGRYSLVLELIAGGELFERVASRGALPEDEASLLMAELCDALGYLHSLGVVHRDVKPENICFETSAPSSSTRLVDFGYATILPLDGTHVRELGPNGYCGTTRYLSPEQLTQDAPDTTQHDMWAAGVVLYILLCGFPPFTAQPPALFEHIKACKYEMPSPEWDHVSEAAKELVRALLVADPEKRLTAEQAAEHPWIVTCGGVLGDVTA